MTTSHTVPAPARPPGAGPLPGAPGASRPSARGGGTVLAKMYPRGNHWAVGHLMGKKSSEESPYMSEGNSLKQQLREFICGKNKGQQKPSAPQLQDSGSRQPSWDTEDSSNLKDVGPKCRSETNVFVNGSRMAKNLPQLGKK
uniref:Gastrin-releasing peptide n=1 Tax=Castor canadensis TaxID=51338 RepID=A0A8C0W933_CASCN